MNMKKYFRHLKTITLHKWYVMMECFKMGLYWQGITHDLSKYSITEFFTSARYFQGDKSPVEAEKAEKKYSVSWLNHKAKNKHHWEYWVDFTEGKGLVLPPIPDKYIKEMACDFIGASKAYNAGKFSRDKPLAYFAANCHKMIMEDKSLLKLRKLLEDYAFSLSSSR
jgi:hypothetical protein